MNSREPQNPIDPYVELGAGILREAYNDAIGNLETVRDTAQHVRTHDGLLTFLKEQAVAEALSTVIFSHPDASGIQLYASIITGPGKGAHIPLLPEGTKQPRELTVGHYAITPRTSLGDVMIQKTPTKQVGRKSSIAIPGVRNIVEGTLHTAGLAYTTSVSIGPFGNIASRRTLPFITYETTELADEAAASYAEGLQLLTGGVLDNLKTAS